MTEVKSPPEPLISLCVLLLSLSSSLFDMTRVHFASQLAAPPVDRTRMVGLQILDPTQLRRQLTKARLLQGFAYPRVAQDIKVHDRIGSRDLYWGNRPLSSMAVDEEDEDKAPVAIIESPTDSLVDDPASINPSLTTEEPISKQCPVKLHPILAKHLPTHITKRMQFMSTHLPSSLPLLATPCSSNDSSSQSSDSSGRSSPNSGFLEEHMRRREEELTSRGSGLFEVSEEAEPHHGGECAVAS